MRCSPGVVLAQTTESFLCWVPAVSPCWVSATLPSTDTFRSATGDAAKLCEGEMAAGSEMRLMMILCQVLSSGGDVATADYLNRLQSTHKNNFVHHITCHCERCSSCHMQVLTEILANGIIWQIKKGNDFWRATSVTIEASASVTMSEHHEVVPHSRGTRGC